MNNPGFQAGAAVADKRVKRRIELRQLTTSLTAGVVVGVVNLAFTLSIAALLSFTNGF